MERGQVDQDGVCWVHFEQVDWYWHDHHPGVRVIVCPATGLDHIDLEGCKFRGIEVLSLQGETEFLRQIPSTAEHTWALILALVRRIPWAFDDVRAGNWDRDAFQGVQLQDKWLGILGYGRVGEQVAKIADAFGMHVVPLDADDMLHPDVAPHVVPRVDILSIHLPLTGETRGRVNCDAMWHRLPEGAYIVNTSRAEIVDTGDLEDALDEGHIAGYATDFAGGRLWSYAKNHDNVLITPHLGGNTKEARAATDDFMQAKLERWLKENPLSAALPAS